MRPKRKKDIVAIVSKERSIREKDVHEAISVYWEEVADHIRGLKTLDIKIDGMGTFHFAKSKLEELEGKIVRTMAKMVDNTKLKREYDQLQILKQQRQQQYDKRTLTQQRKLDYQAKKALDEQVENPGGPVVQPHSVPPEQDTLGSQTSRAA